MYYYLKGKNRIGPVGAGRIIELSDAGAIDDSTLVWNKAERWPKWRRLGDCRAEISESRKVCRHSGHLRGLARSTMFFRAFLISAIAVMGVQIFYTARNYGLLLEYLGGSGAPQDDEFKISIAVAVRTLSFVNLMLAAVLAFCLFRCFKWAKHAVMVCYAASKRFQLSFSSENSYRWFFLQPFKMLGALFASAASMCGRRPAFGDRFFLFSVRVLTFAYAAMLFVNTFILEISHADLSTAKLSYCYLVFTSSVGICAAVLWIVCVTRIFAMIENSRGRGRGGKLPGAAGSAARP